MSIAGLVFGGAIAFWAFIAGMALFLGNWFGSGLSLGMSLCFIVALSLALGNDKFQHGGIQ